MKLPGGTYRTSAVVVAASSTVAAATIAAVAFASSGGSGSSGLDGRSAAVDRRPAAVDRRPPSPPAGLRVIAALPPVLAWEPAVDNVGVVGYDVRIGRKRGRVVDPRVPLVGVACGGVDVRIVALDRAANRSKAATASIRVPSCPRLPRPMAAWSGDFENGDESQWDYIHRFAPERFSVVRSDGNVIPRGGSHMARVEVRHNEPASWTSAANVALAEKTAAPGGLGELGADSYVGFSLFLPRGFPAVPSHFANNIFEWHGNSNDVQASVHMLIDTFYGKHYGIVNRTPGFVLDVHTEPGYNPVMFRFGDVVTGRWVDFVIRVRWATDASGIVEGWMDGVKRFTSARKTWYSGGQISHVRPQLGYYRANYSRTAVLYVDSFRLGRSYEAVAP